MSIFNATSLKDHFSGEKVSAGLFGELKAVNPTVDISLIFTRQLDTDQEVVVSTSGTGSNTPQFNRSLLKTATGGVGSASVQTLNKLRYKPGSTIECNFTAAWLGTIADHGSGNDEAFIGLFMTCSGVYLGYDGADFIVAYRNLYAEDGATPGTGGIADVKQIVSMTSYDLTKLHRFRIKFGFLGVGDILFEIKPDNGGDWKLLHRFNTDGSLETSSNIPRTHIGCPLTPMRLEVDSPNNGNDFSIYTASWSASVWTKDHNRENKPYFNHGSRSVTPSAAGAAFVAFRNPTTFQSYPNAIRSQALSLSFATMSEGLYSITFYKGTIATIAAVATGGSGYQTVSSHTPIEYHNDFTVASAVGTEVAAILLPVPSGGNGANSSELDLEKLGMYLDPGYAMLIAIKELVAGAGTDTTAWAISWYDQT